MTISVQGRSRRAELGDFLKARRAQVSPADVGLPPGPRRRTPGLRREEVAQLAGVGVTWYTWLEQGRPINVSSQVLDAVARTLGLSPPERTHLYRLTESTPVRSAPESCPDESTLVEILMALDPLPAVISNARFDILFEELWSRHEVAACQPRPRHVRTSDRWRAAPNGHRNDPPGVPRPPPLRRNPRRPPNPHPPLPGNPTPTT